MEVEGAFIIKPPTVCKKTVGKGERNTSLRNNNLPPLTQRTRTELLDARKSKTTEAVHSNTHTNNTGRRTGADHADNAGSSLKKNPTELQR